MLVEWFIGRLVDWFFDWHEWLGSLWIGWLGGWLVISRLIGWLIGKNGWLARMVGWLTGINGWVGGWLSGRLVGWHDWLVDWHEWLVRWLVGWLVG